MRDRIDRLLDRVLSVALAAVLLLGIAWGGLVVAWLAIPALR